MIIRIEKKITQILILILVISFFVFNTEIWPKVYIDINAPSVKKFPIAISELKSLSNLPDEKKSGSAVRDTLSADLDFSGFFSIVDVKNFPSNYNEEGITGQEIDFKKWTFTGAELLIKGAILQKGDSVSVEMRLFDITQGQFITGKKYNGKTGDLRKIAHKFSNEILLKLSGTQGVFDTKIAFVSNETGNKEIYLMDYDGFNIYRLTSNKSINLAPNWSPDGKKLIYSSFKTNSQKLYLLDLMLFKETNLSDRKGLNLGGAWCRDNNRIAVTLSVKGNSDIFTMSPDGSNPKRLTDNFSIDVSPSWSPDGKWLAFTSSRSGTPQIYIMDSDGGSLRRLTFEGNYNASPCWSPKGDKIAFASQQNGLFDICIINIDGSDLKRFTYNSGNNESPSWSPDGRFIAFSSTRTGMSKIYIMNSNGSNQRLVGATKGNESNPSWSPVINTNN
ncbi:MAG: Tol-Pal system beta propeller repeat protein TolB [Candidatus Schekmanbacteria bacterium RBG_16_38_10]|uniref:Tol-Pal system beta propeller repeat protein TolB n=1 Tax=Candidatus Schekmanbacteria bacterium RBG_16_38_10 TaxID=1817879 RepID=A0A1F7RXG4_9BACT|nr:MAG: Tol-Pal system beta propeller repeat protein TolB [Candidatus Schekmanbacteria bacterium RBG_16_38_10]